MQPGLMHALVARTGHPGSSASGVSSSFWKQHASLGSAFLILMEDHTGPCPDAQACYRPLCRIYKHAIGQANHMNEPRVKTQVNRLWVEGTAELHIKENLSLFIIYLLQGELILNAQSRCSFQISSPRHLGNKHL